MLTRHFYTVDEVHAALQYTSHRVEHQETLFWCKELICSGFVGETISTLFESWIWHRGPFHLRWLINTWNTLASDEITEDVILLSAYQLSSCTRIDHSLWSILVLTIEDAMPDHVTPLSPAFPSDDPKEMYFIRALYQGKARCAWWISRHFTDERVWWLLDWYTECIAKNAEYRICLEAFKNYEQLLGYRSDKYDIIIRCLAVISFCVRHDTFKELPSLDSRYLKTLDEWNTHEGRMSRRIYGIPTACLYGTQRGHLRWTQQNTVQLNYVERGLIGCPFWEEALADYSRIDDDIKWVSDDALEAFYDKYFPDDIPDEWPKKEKQKSHGDGILGPNEKISLLKYARIHLSRICRLAWNTTADVHRIITEMTDCNPCNIVTHFKVPLEVSDAELAPRRKRLIV